MRRLGRFALWLWRGGLGELTAWVACFGVVAASVGAAFHPFGPAPLRWFGWIIVGIVALFAVGCLLVMLIQIPIGVVEWVRVAWHRSAR